MIEAIERMLKKMGLISPIEKDDIINASIEDSARNFDDALSKLRDTLKERKASVAHLRQSIKTAQEKTHAFEDFEKLVVNRSGRRINGG